MSGVFTLHLNIPGGATTDDLRFPHRHGAEENCKLPGVSGHSLHKQHPGRRLMKTHVRGNIEHTN
eukprot:351442-Chlamydomonas_euryale.AAC.5